MAQLTPNAVCNAKVFFENEFVKLTPGIFNFFQLTKLATEM